MRLVLLMTALTAISAGGCALIMPEKKQDPFPTIEVKATRPPPGPDRVVLTASNIAIMDKVQFETGSATVKPVSFPLLDEVAKVMKDNPQIEEVEVDGHTDSTGAADFNRKLSQQRAESVMKYITGKGIKSARLTAKGFGPDKPVADNESDAGREANRRVEFNILKQGPKKTVVKDQ